MSSQNIRSLLRAELSTRRITHPQASYANNKSNLLSCTVCHLIIKSDSLWEGHLRSANHRKNVQKLQQGQQQGQQQENGSREEARSGGRKRKADSIDVDEDDDRHDVGSTNGARGRKRKAEEDTDDDEGAEGRKKTKSDLPPSPPPASRAMTGFIPASAEAAQSTPAVGTTSMPDVPCAEKHEAITNAATQQSTDEPDVSTASAQPSTINEDEYAAFEREVLPLTTPHNNLPTQPSSSTAIISAAPISASELAAQKSTTDNQAKGRWSREDEADAEREEEGRRMEYEFEVQEEMEGRVRRLRERRERIRLAGEGGGGVEGGGGGGVVETGGTHGIVEDAVLGGKGVEQGIAGREGIENNEDDEDDEDEFDEWGFS